MVTSPVDLGKIAAQRAGRNSLLGKMRFGFGYASEATKGARNLVGGVAGAGKTAIGKGLKGAGIVAAGMAAVGGLIYYFNKSRGDRRYHDEPADMVQPSVNDLPPVMTPEMIAASQAPAPQTLMGLTPTPGEHAARVRGVAMNPAAVPGTPDVDGKAVHHLG